MCSEALTAVVSMALVANAHRVESPLPAPDASWIKARIAERERLRERALRPVRVARALGEFISLAALPVAVLASWPAIAEAVRAPAVSAIIGAGVDGLLAVLTSPIPVVAALGALLVQPFRRH